MVVKTIPRWRTAAILKIDKSPYLSEQVALLSQRPRDASCLSVVSFNSRLQNVEQSLLFLVTEDTDLLLRTVKCAVLLSLA